MRRTQTRISFTIYMSDLEVDVYFYWKKNCFKKEDNKGEDGFIGATVKWETCNHIKITFFKPVNEVDAYWEYCKIRMRHILGHIDKFRETESYKFNASAGIYGEKVKEDYMEATKRWEC